MRKHTVTKTLKGLLAADVFSASADKLLHKAWEWNWGLSNQSIVNAPSRNLVAFTCHATAKRCQITVES